MRGNSLPTSCSFIQNCVITLQCLCSSRELFAAPKPGTWVGSTHGQMWQSATRSTGAQGGCGLHVLHMVLTAPQDLIIPLAIKLHMDLLSMICESQRAVFMTRQLAEETPFLLFLGPPNMLQETAPSEGHQFNHNSLLQSNRFRLARVDWRLFDLFINLASLAECCPQSSPVALVLELPKHTFPIFLPSSGLHQQATARLGLPQQEGQMLRCVLALPQLRSHFLGARPWSQHGFLLWGQTSCSPSGCRGEHMGAFSWEHTKLSTVLVISSLMFLPLPGDTTPQQRPTTACVSVSSNKQPCLMPQGERAPGSSIQK